MKYAIRPILFLLLLVAASVALAQAPVVEVTPLLETDPTPDDNANAIAIWVHPEDLSQSAFIGADEDGGLMVLDLDGHTLQVLPEGAVTNLDLRYNFPLGARRITLIVAVNQDDNALNFYEMNPETRQLEKLSSHDTGILVSGVCMYVSPVSGTYYAFTNSENGDVQQWALGEDGGRIIPTLVRQFQVGSETEGCAADDELAWLYISEEDVAIWRYAAEPESESPRRVVDYVGNHLEGAVEGLTLYYAGDGKGYLIASNDEMSRYLVYERDGDNAFVGAFEVGATETIDGAQEANGIRVLSFALGDAYPSGVFITTDDDNTNPNDNTNYKVVAWAAIADALDLSTDTTIDPRLVGVSGASAGGAMAAIPQVPAAAQTDPVVSSRDAADDPAIWIHPTDPALSTVIGSDKGNGGGLAVYDLSGAQIHYVQIGEVNNVDIRYGFPLGDTAVDLVAASDRTANAIALYAVNPETRELESIAARPLEVGLREIYGLCMYHSPVSSAYYVFANSTREGDVEQWELFATGAGTIDARLVRSFTVGSQTEGCVADDELGDLYIGEEGVGVWKYGAEPEDGDARAAVDDAEGGHLVPDVEGMALYYGSDGAGYLIVSSQGNSTFVVYTREGDNAYVGTFQVAESEFADAVTGTDGLDVTSAALGSAFPDGLFVAQDDRKINPAGNQNFKLVSWTEIANALGLTTGTTYAPRATGE